MATQNLNKQGGIVMRKQIKKWGNSLIILIDSEDSSIYNLREGDVVEIEISKVVGAKDGKI